MPHKTDEGHVEMENKMKHSECQYIQVSSWTEHSYFHKKTNHY
jgi:hypothetical protein